MICVIQRVSQAQVAVNAAPIGVIGNGLLVLVGVHVDDTESHARWMGNKLADIRIFADAAGKMNLSVLQLPPGAPQAPTGVLLVPNFTLCAAPEKGNRPGFDAAMRPPRAQTLFEVVAQTLRSRNVHTATGQFGADMQVSLVNDGPVTIVLRSPPPDPS